MVFRGACEARDGSQGSFMQHLCSALLIHLLGPQLYCQTSDQTAPLTYVELGIFQASDSGAFSQASLSPFCVKAVTAGITLIFGSGHLHTQPWLGVFDILNYSA